MTATATRNGRASKAVVEEVSNQPIIIPQSRRIRLYVPIIGTAPLICNRFGDSAKESLRAKFEGAVIDPNKSKKRNPVREYEEASYRTPEGGYGFPGGAVKDAMGDAVILLKTKVPNIPHTKAGLMRIIHVRCDLLRLEFEGEKPEMVEDVIVNPMKGAVLVYRPYFHGWRTVVPFEFNEVFVTVDEVLSYLRIAGENIGIGNWRPDKKGDFGTFDIDDNNIVKEG